MAFLNSFSIFIISFLNSLCIRQKWSLSLFLQGKKELEVVLQLLHFTYISLTLSLRETITYCGLESLFICVTIPVYLVWFTIFDMRAVFSMGASCLFSQSVLTLNLLMGLSRCSGSFVFLESTLVELASASGSLRVWQLVFTSRTHVSHVLLPEKVLMGKESLMMVPSLPLHTLPKITPCFYGGLRLLLQTPSVEAAPYSNCLHSANPRSIPGSGL